MDILASIFAYLFCVAGLLGAMAISAMLVLSPAHHAAAPVPVASAQTTIQTAAVAAKSTAKSTAAELPATSTMASAVVVAQPEAASAKNDAPRLSKKEARRKTALAQARRLLQEDKARRWAYQQDADFDTRFLGYAD